MPTDGGAGARFVGRRVLITGGLGFIGSTLAIRLVEAGARVTLIDSLVPEYGGNINNVAGIADRVLINISDVRDPFSFAHLVRDQEILFNLAGQTSHMDSMTDPKTDLDINCAAQLSILEACRRHNPGVRLVFASTRQIYGRPRYLPVNEEHPLQPVDVNGVNKLAGENYHILYQQVHGIPTTVLRLTNVIGPRMRIRDARQTFVGIWIRNLIEGKPIEVWGGSQLRDLLDVEDCVDAFLLAAVNPAAVGQIYNVGSPESISLADLAREVVAANGGGEIITREYPADRKRIDIGDYCTDATKISAEIGWTARTSLSNTLARCFDYYRSQIAHYT
jgi:UDP-glucose 4-epimerase